MKRMARNMVANKKNTIDIVFRRVDGILIIRLNNGIVNFSMDYGGAMSTW